MFDPLISDDERRYLLNHLRDFEIPNPYELNWYIAKIFALLIVCSLSLILIVYEGIMSLSGVIVIIVMLSTIYITSKEIIRLSRWKELTSLTEPSEILLFLQRYGKISEGAIVAIDGNQTTRLTYRFGHGVDTKQGHYVTTKRDKKKVGETIKVLHWEDIIHIPIFDS